MNQIVRLGCAATVAGIAIASAQVAAQAASGYITGVLIAGPNDANHPNVVQITVSGGYTQAGCDSTYNAIRNTPQNKEMIALAMLAYVSGKPVLITLDSTDIYFAGRCAIARIDAR